MKKQLLATLLTFATISCFATAISANIFDSNKQNRLIFLEQLQSILNAGKEEGFSPIEISESDSILQKTFNTIHNTLTNPRNEYTLLFSNIVTEMYHSSNDPVTTKIKNYHNQLTTTIFNKCNALDHNEKWLNAVQLHGIYLRETQETLRELVTEEMFMTSLHNDDEDYDLSYDEIKQCYQAYLSFHKNHIALNTHLYSPKVQALSPNQLCRCVYYDCDDSDEDIENENDTNLDFAINLILDFISVPALKDRFNQLLTKINTEITTLKRLEADYWINSPLFKKKVTQIS